MGNDQPDRAGAPCIDCGYYPTMDEIEEHGEVCPGCGGRGGGGGPVLEVEMVTQRRGLRSVAKLKRWMARRWYDG